VSQPLLADAHKSFENVAVARSRIFILLQFEFEYSDLNFYLNNLFFELVDLLLSKMQLLLVLFSLLLLFILFNTQKRRVALSHRQWIHPIFLDDLGAAYARRVDFRYAIWWRLVFLSDIHSDCI
jgi:uncharacterized integral membrane protein